MQPISTISFKNSSCHHVTNICDTDQQMNTWKIHQQNPPYSPFLNHHLPMETYDFPELTSYPCPWASQWVLDHPPVASCQKNWWPGSSMGGSSPENSWSSSNGDVEVVLLPTTKLVTMFTLNPPIFSLKYGGVGVQKILTFIECNWYHLPRRPVEHIRGGGHRHGVQVIHEPRRTAYGDGCDLWKKGG